jgi:hypothetical protein
MQTLRLLFRCVLSCGTLLALAVNGWSVAPRAELRDQEKERFLLHAEIVKTRPAPGGTTGSLRLTLTDGLLTHDAHFQTVDVYEPSRPTPDGVELNFRDCYKFNIAAYRLDRLISLRMVPVSVERRIRGDTGALTWWVDNVQMRELERYEKKIRPPNWADWLDQLYNARLFNELVYNTDRNLGNFLITEDWQLRSVDFTRAFRWSRKLKTPENLTRIDRRVYNGLRNLDEATLTREMGPLLRDAEITGLLARRDRILEVFREKIEEKGETAVICDRVGH